MLENEVISPKIEIAQYLCLRYVRCMNFGNHVLSQVFTREYLKIFFRQVN